MDIFWYYELSKLTAVKNKLQYFMTIPLDMWIYVREKLRGWILPPVGFGPKAVVCTTNCANR